MVYFISFLIGCIMLAPLRCMCCQALVVSNNVDRLLWVDTVWIMALTKVKVTYAWRSLSHVTVYRIKTYSLGLSSGKQTCLWAIILVCGKSYYVIVSYVFNLLLVLARIIFFKAEVYMPQLISRDELRFCYYHGFEAYSSRFEICGLGEL